MALSPRAEAPCVTGLSTEVAGTTIAGAQPGHLMSRGSVAQDNAHVAAKRGLKIVAPTVVLLLNRRTVKPSNRHGSGSATVRSWVANRHRVPEKR